MIRIGAFIFNRQVYNLFFLILTVLISPFKILNKWSQLRNLCIFHLLILGPLLLLLIHRNLVLKFKLHLPHVPVQVMLTLLNTFSNAKKTIELLQTFPLDHETIINIRKLKEILDEQEHNHCQIKNYETDSPSRKEEGDYEGIMEKVTGVGKSDQDDEEREGSEINNKEANQEFLEKIVEEIQQLISMNEERTEDKSSLKQNYNGSETFGSDLSTQVYTLLQKIGEQIKIYIKNSSNTKPIVESNSDFSYKSHPIANVPSNPGSVRSLLTEKLKQFANEEFDDPQYKNERVVIQGNLMRQLSKHQRNSKPIIVSRRFQELSEPFSMQNKHFNQRELHNWPKGSAKDPNGRVHSQRTILGEINLSQSHMKEKRAKKDEGGCSRCEIY